MNTRHIVVAMTSALLTVGLIPFGSAQTAFGSAQEGIEVITVVGKRAVPAVPEGIEVITVVGKRPEPTVASTCMNEVMAGRKQNPGGEIDAQALTSQDATRDSVRQAIRDCIDLARTPHS